MPPSIFPKSSPPAVIKFDKVGSAVAPPFLTAIHPDHISTPPVYANISGINTTLIQRKNYENPNVNYLLTHTRILTNLHLYDLAANIGKLELGARINSVQYYTTSTVVIDFGMYGFFTMTLMEDREFCDDQYKQVFVAAYIAETNPDLIVSKIKSLGVDPDTFTHTVTWAMSSDGWDIALKRFPLQTSAFPAVDEMYPFIEDGLDTFFSNFSSSDNGILVLAGPPGTGKTTFLRELLLRTQKHAIFTFDQRLFKSDHVFTLFMEDDYHDFFILEDADTMLFSRGDREHDDTLIAKFLNISDGLIKGAMRDKKLIFTTNIVDLQQVDEALLRPGRCFDVVEFRKLSGTEAKKLAEKLNLPVEVNIEKDYTLGELFNNKSAKSYNVKSKKMGFV